MLVHTSIQGVEFPRFSILVPAGWLVAAHVTHYHRPEKSEDLSRLDPGLRQDDRPRHTVMLVKPALADS
jgi:hypothetical protein